MPITVLTPSIEQRMAAYVELTNRVRLMAPPAQLKPTITLSREFGCEAFPVAEELVKVAEQKTGESWLLVDKSLLDEVAKDHRISQEIMHSLGEKPRFIDEMFATFSKNWKGDADYYYRLLCEQVVMVATAGNAVIVGLGAAIITKAMKNCFHFRLIAHHDFKVRSIARRMNIPKQEAEIIVLNQQKERDRIIRRVLDADEHEPLHYHVIFNNAKIKNPQIAEIIFDHVFSSKG